VVTSSPTGRRALLALATAVTGLVGAATVYLGLVDAVPVVDFNTDLDRQLRREGARQVVVGCLPLVVAGSLLLVGRATWTGALVVGCALLIALLARADSAVSWVLLVVLVLAGLVGCLRLLVRPA
jgi:hypothetical protein